MSRVNDLIRQVARQDPELAEELRTEVDLLAERRSFGLNFERHVPESVELPGRPVRRGDKVRVLPPRGEKRKKEHDTLWRVVSVSSDDGTASVVRLGEESEEETVALEDLVVVAEFRDPIYPGLVSTGKVERGGDKPFHTVINAENYHALQALLYTHRGKVDVIYIDPPYNIRDKDWKYNNYYVDRDDLYGHSKWLAMMERRLLLSKELLSPGGLIMISIDDHEMPRLSLLCDEIFGFDNGRSLGPLIWFYEGVNENYGSIRKTHEYVLCYQPEPLASKISRNLHDPNVKLPKKIDNSVVKNGSKNPPSTIQIPRGFPAAFPSGTIEAESCSALEWSEDIVVEEGKLVNPTSATSGWSSKRILENYIHSGMNPVPDSKGQETTFYITQAGNIHYEKVRDHSYVLSVLRNLGTTSAASDELRNIDLEFDYPKPVGLVEFLLQLHASPEAVVLDFFAGSGTTADAVMRLNAKDGGLRTSISVTNNEVSDEKNKDLSKEGLRPGDPEWEAQGICHSVTNPRIKAVVSGELGGGKALEENGELLEEGLDGECMKENVEFFDLTYETPLMVKSHRDFERIAPLLWLRAGSVGRRIEDLSAGWDVAESYGVLSDLDQAEAFLEAIEAGPDVGIAFIVTDDDRLFESVARDLPDGVEPVRLYESYLKNFEIVTARSAT